MINHIGPVPKGISYNHNVYISCLIFSNRGIMYLIGYHDIYHIQYGIVYVFPLSISMKPQPTPGAEIQTCVGSKRERSL